MPLIKSIITTIAAFFFGETAVFLLFSRIYHFHPDFFWYFLMIQAGFHLAILLFLVLNTSFFYNIHSGVAEANVNLCNKITLFRISMLPFLVFLIFASQKYPTRLILVIAIALTFFTDCIDGRIARTKNMETYMGRILDSASDYMLLGATAAAFFFFSLIKKWLFLLIIGRLFMNTLGMLILVLVKKKIVPQTTFFGKTAIASIMILLVLESAELFFGSFFLIWYVEIAVGFTIVVSVIDKGWYFIRTLREAK